MTSAHLTSTNMQCDNTFLCPRRLFSSPISSWLCSPRPRKVTKLSLFQPPEVYKEHGMGQDFQSHLCCHLDNTSPRLVFTSTCTAASGCSMPRLEELAPVSPCSCPPRGPQLFQSQVTHLSRTCLQVHYWLSLISHFATVFIPFEKAFNCSMDFFCGAVILL